MNSTLKMAYFDWKEADKLIQFIENVTANGPLCFRLADTGEDAYVLIYSEKPFISQDATSLYLESIAQNID